MSRYENHFVVYSYPRNSATPYRPFGMICDCGQGLYPVFHITISYFYSTFYSTFSGFYSTFYSAFSGFYSTFSQFI